MYDIFMAIQHRVCFERLTQEFDILFYYNFQEGVKLKLLYLSIIQIKYGIGSDQKYYIIKNIIQEYWQTNTKEEIKSQKSPFPIDT